MNLNNSTILITGGATGIGLSLAKALTLMGNTVIICARTQENLDTAKVSVPALITYTCDISNSDEVDAMLASITSEGYEIDGLINNAAMISPLNLLCSHTKTVTSIRRDVCINIMGVIELTHKLLPLFQKKQTGFIINISSPAGVIPIAQTPGYSLTKAALHSYTQTLRYHYQSSPIRIIEVFPPSVATQMSAMNGRKDMDCDLFAQQALKKIACGKSEIWIGESYFVRLFAKLPRFLSFNLINRMVPLIK
jgi:uncharacterized oxidoreductase